MDCVLVLDAKCLGMGKELPYLAAESIQKVKDRKVSLLLLQDEIERDLRFELVVSRENLGSLSEKNKEMHVMTCDYGVFKQAQQLGWTTIWFHSAECEESVTREVLA